MRVLVTGAAGFIGSHTCERLVARGHDVVGLDRFDDFLYPAAPKRANADDLRAALPGDRFRLVEGDICDGELVARLVGDVDAVCHLAALAGVRPSLRDPRRYVRVNLEGTLSVFEACRAAGVRRVAFASSSSVYGKRAAGRAFREDDPCLEPASPYGATKRAGELLCSTYRDLYGLGVSALRFFTVYGPRQRPDMMVHKLLRAVVTGEPVPVYGDGTSARDYTFIDDIVAGTIAAVERVQPGAFEIYNLGGHETTTLADLVATVERVTGHPVPIDRQPMQPGDVPLTFADVTKAARDLDYAPTTDVATGIARYWEWFRGRPMP
ncbi:MAG: NAD-dependent epimerase/dehydratase family protein [Deltaproteobacteria bacterium]|nr:MAG: NAD-dependent epimerase/dehydratase family protein [Deltaproteobacteria bacterium]